MALARRSREAHPIGGEQPLLDVTRSMQPAMTAAFTLGQTEVQ